MDVFFSKYFFFFLEKILKFLLFATYRENHFRKDSFIFFVNHHNMPFAISRKSQSAYGYLSIDFTKEDICLTELNTKKLENKGQAKEGYSFVKFLLN